MTFSAAQVAILALSISTALIYLGWFLHRDASVIRSCFKTVPVAALAVLVPIFDGPLLLMAALVLSAIGDLALSRDGDHAFRLGLGSFLLGHLAYVALFWEPSVDLLPAQYAAFIVIFAVASGALALLWRGLGPMRWPVVAYVVVIAVMAIAAVLRGGPLPLLVGAALFMASDLVLGMETFRLPATARRMSAPIVWITYYAAQVLIAAAFLCPQFAG